MGTKVLIIDDKKEDIFSIRKSLKRAGFEYTYVEAKTGDKGLDKVREVLPDIVIVEVKLPNINGFDMCKRIKGISNTVKVLIVTRHQDAVDYAMATDASADGHSVKTKSNKYLIASFKEIVEKLGIEKRVFESNP